MDPSGFKPSRSQRIDPPTPLGRQPVPHGGVRHTGAVALAPAPLDAPSLLRVVRALGSQGAAARLRAECTLTTPRRATRGGAATPTGLRTLGHLLGSTTAATYSRHRAEQPCH